MLALCQAAWGLWSNPAFANMDGDKPELLGIGLPVKRANSFGPLGIPSQLKVDHATCEVLLNTDVLGCLTACFL